MRRSAFSDALTLLDLLVQATGEGKELLEEWRKGWQKMQRERAEGVAVAIPEEEGDEGEAAEPRRRPRKRRRRRR